MVFGDAGSDLLIILILDLLVATACIIGCHISFTDASRAEYTCRFYRIILPYLLQNDKEATIRATQWQWKFDPDDMSDEATSQQKLAAQLYVEFIDLLIQLSCCMVACSLLLAPINWHNGDKFDSENTFFERTSSLNLTEGDNTLWLHAMYSWVMSVVVTTLVVRARRRVQLLANEYKEKYDFGGSALTLAVKGLSEHVVDPVQLEADMNAQLPHVTRIHIAYELSKLLDLSRKLQLVDKCRVQCRRAIELNFQPRGICGCPVSAAIHHVLAAHLFPVEYSPSHLLAAVEYLPSCLICSVQVDLAELLVRLAERRLDLEGQIKDEKQFPLKGTGWAFVSFTSKHEASLALEQNAVQSCLSAAVGSASEEVKVDFASEPDEAEYVHALPIPVAAGWIVSLGCRLVVWKHLKYSTARRSTQNCCGTFVAFLVVVLIFSGTATLEVLDSIVKSLPDWIGTLLSSYLPMLLTIVCAWLLVPLLLTGVAELTPFARHDNYAIWYLNRYFIYLMLAIVFVTTTAMSVAALLKSWFSTHDASSTFSSVFDTKYTVYFIRYSLNFALLSSPLELLQYTELMISQLESAVACCARRLGEHQMDWVTRQDIFGTGVPQIVIFEYPRQYVVVLHIFAIGLLYSAILPMITPFTLFYLVMKRKMDCFNLLLQPQISVEFQSGAYTGNSTVALQMLNLLVASLVLYQVGMISFFARHLRADLGVLTTVVAWLSSGTYFGYFGCAKIPCVQKHLDEFKEYIEETGLPFSPAINMASTLNVSTEEYAHPALSMYLGPDRTLAECLQGVPTKITRVPTYCSEDIPNMIDHNAGNDSSVGEVGHSIPEGAEGEWAALKDEMSPVSSFASLSDCDGGDRDISGSDIELANTHK